MSCFSNKSSKHLRKSVIILSLNKDKSATSTTDMSIQYICITEDEIRMINAEKLIAEIIFFTKVIKKAVICFKILCRQLTKAYKETELHEKDSFTFFLCLLPLLQ